MAALLRGTSAAKAVTLSEFRECFDQMLGKASSHLQSLLQKSKIAVAFSGGPDSVALCALLRQAFPKDKLVAVFVDHNMQSRGVTESTDFVKDALQKLDIEGKYMKVEWGEGELERLTKGQTQETLRDRRQRLLLEACAADDVRLLVTGHNLDDDIVTMFYRMSHASGLDGLSGMRPLGAFPITHPMGDRVLMGHPLLMVSKERLHMTCESLGLTWNKDESNQDGDYLRNSTTATLAKMQGDGIVSFEDLQTILEFFKTFRKDMSEVVIPAFDKSVAINRRNGDALFVLNDERLVRNRPVLSRVISILAQYAGVRFGQIRTSRLLDMHGKIMAAYEKYQVEQKQLGDMLARRFKKALQLFPLDQARRVETGQMIINNATFYPLSRSDSYRRVQFVIKTQNREIQFGPAFLVQRQPPNSLNYQKACSSPVEVKLKPGETFCWDTRFELSYEVTADQEAPAEPQSFLISFATPADARDFEKVTVERSALRRKLYAHMGVTPGSHLYQIPVIREVDGSYMAFPTLDCASDDRYRWAAKPLGLNYLVTKFHCSP